MSYKLVDMRTDGWLARTGAYLAEGRPEFCFSFQGMGMNLRIDDGGNFWSRNSIPFVSHLGNNPYHAPSLHAAEGTGLYLLYGCRDSLETYQFFMHGRACASILRAAYPENELADRTPWDQRKHSIVFVKTAVDSEMMRRRWAQLPRLVRDILHDSAAAVLSGIDKPVATLCAQVLADRQIHWGDRQELFLSTCSMVDFYARAVRSERMVRALMRHNALIVGDWSHLDQFGARADFRKSIPAHGLDELYADTRIVVSTTPTVRFAVHERVIAGLLAKAAVVSDTTPYLQQLLRDCPSFHGVDIDQHTFTDEIDHALTCCLRDPAMSAKVGQSAVVARELFSLDALIQQLLEYVALENYRQQLDWWIFPPGSSAGCFGISGLNRTTYAQSPTICLQMLLIVKWRNAMTFWQPDNSLALGVHGVTRRHKVNSLTDEKVEAIRRNGYTVYEGALTPEEARTAGALLDNLYDRQVQEIGGMDRLEKINDQNIVRSMLVYEHAFLHLANNPLLMPIIKAILGENISLGAQVGILNRPTERNYQESWHRELQYQHFVSSQSLAVQVLYALDPFTCDNGGTFFLPSSQMFEEFPSDGFVRRNEIQIEAPIGSAIVFDAMLYHRGAPNRTNAVRRAVNNLYTLPMIQQQINFAKMLNGRYSEDPELFNLLGYRWNTADNVSDWRERHLNQKGK